MTEMSMAPERGGWFDGVKRKVAETFKRFSVAGAKEHFYTKNADLINKATATLSAEDKQKANTIIEQEALGSAKVDVAVHWGAAILGTAAATVGLGMFSDKVRNVAEKYGGKLGHGYADLGRRAKGGLDKLLSKFKFMRVGSSMATKGMPTTEQRLRQAVRNDQIYKNQALKDAAAGRTFEKTGKSKPINPDSVKPVSQIINELGDQIRIVRKKLLDRRIVGDARVNLEEQLKSALERRKNLRV